MDETDKDVWDEDSHYLEFLANEGARLRAQQEKREAAAAAAGADVALAGRQPAARGGARGSGAAP